MMGYHFFCFGLRVVVRIGVLLTFWLPSTLQKVNPGGARVKGRVFVKR